MELQTKKIEGLNNPEIKVYLAKERSAPPTMPNKPVLGVFCGSRGSGKSSAIINFVKLYAPYHFFDKIYLFSPTFDNDLKMAKLIDDRYTLKVIREISQDILMDTLDEIKKDIEEYKEYKEYYKLWKKIMKFKSLDDFINQATPEEIALLQKNDYQLPETEFKYGMPQSLIIFDDLVENPIVYRNPKLNEFLLRHRHFLTHVIFSVQKWKGAVPRGIRNNLSMMVMFKNKSLPIKKEIAEELSAYITLEDFIKMWDFACQENHDFFMVNFDDPKHRFRRNFNEIFITDSK